MAGVTGLQDPDKFSEHQLERWAEMEQHGYVHLAAWKGFLFRTGFAQAIQDEYCCLLWDRSGMGGAKQVHRLAGVIDPDYRGEWFVRLVNNSDTTVTEARAWRTGRPVCGSMV